MNKIEKLINFLKENFPDGIQMFNKNDIPGLDNIYYDTANGVLVYYCYEEYYINIFGLTDEEFNQVNIKINKQINESLIDKKESEESNMLTIKMDDGSLYKFKAEEYTDYTITNEYIVVKRNECWIGVFDKKHFISLILENK